MLTFRRWLEDSGSDLENAGKRAMFLHRQKGVPMGAAITQAAEEVGLPPGSVARWLHPPKERISWIQPSLASEARKIWEDPDLRRWLASQGMSFEGVESLEKWLGGGKMERLKDQIPPGVISPRRFERQMEDPLYQKGYQDIESRFLRLRKVVLPAPLLLRGTDSSRLVSGHRRIHLATKHHQPISLWVVDLQPGWTQPRLFEGWSFRESLDPSGTTSALRLLADYIYQKVVEGSSFKDQNPLRGVLRWYRQGGESIYAEDSPQQLLEAMVRGKALRLSRGWAVPVGSPPKALEGVVEFLQGLPAPAGPDRRDPAVTWVWLLHRLHRYAEDLLPLEEVLEDRRVEEALGWFSPPLPLLQAWKEVFYSGGQDPQAIGELAKRVSPAYGGYLRSLLAGSLQGVRVG